MLYQVIELAKQLIRRPSISPMDAGCQTLIIDRLHTVGFTVESINVDDTQNFWAWRGQGETLAFAGHTDVVPADNADCCWINPPFDPVIHNGVLFGRGAADMKGSLAAMVVAAEHFIAQHPNHRNRLAFLITSDEEATAKNGTIKIVETLTARNEHLDYCLIGEPSSTEIVGDVVKNGRRGSLTCNLIIHGIQGHVAYPHLVKNPIHQVAPILNELINTNWDHGNIFFPPTSMQIINIQAYTNGINVTPSSIFIQFNFRFSTELTDIMIKTHVETLLRKYHLHYTIDWWLSGQPFLTKRGKLVNAVISAVKRFNKIKPKLLTTGGTSDGRFIAQMGTQVVELGLVNATIHKTNECVKITDLQSLAYMYKYIMEQIIAPDDTVKI